MRQIDERELNSVIADLRARLLAARGPQGYWTGFLSSSALSTATAVYALASVDIRKHRTLIDNGLRWLCAHQNEDGGWGDTTQSPSNLSTTMLCYSALAIVDAPPECQGAVEKTKAWLQATVGTLEPRALAKAVSRQYGKDRTFSIPILTMCALAGRLGRGWRAWRPIKPLPFELAVLPRRLFKWLRLPVVSYALPALIAMGQVRYEYLRPLNPLVRLIRHSTRRKSLRVLEDIQPKNGGFLEAAPLTSFVVMSLVAFGLRHDRIVWKSTKFLVNSVREDGSWPIDTNLATWVTTLAINMFGADESTLSEPDRKLLMDWLLGGQYKDVHPYTQAAPGGWGWSDLPGAVPDADDTAGVLLALSRLGIDGETVSRAVSAGIHWLVDLQNRDGGIPTFCRGWMNLPFDKSAPDITAHSLAAMGVWLDDLNEPLRERVDQAIVAGIEFLLRAQRPDGSWVPLWFGNQGNPEKENPVYGTSRVLTGLSKLAWTYRQTAHIACERAVSWLLSIQNDDGGWGGGASIASTIEETALVVDALAEVWPHVKEGHFSDDSEEMLRSAALQGAQWLIEHVRDTESLPASPIGLYFAQLWYSEALYPVVFTLGALQKVHRFFSEV